LIYTSNSLQGKTYLISGASKGIGRATAKLISRCGGATIITGRNQERLDRTLGELKGTNHLSIPADLVKPDDIENLAAECSELSGIVHCAGISRLAPIRDTTANLMREMTTTNVDAPVALTRELLKKEKLLPGSSIIFMSSLSAIFGWTGYIAYSASKAALISVTRTLASELADKKIRCNCLAPGMIETPMLKGGFSEDKLKEEESKYPFGFGKPVDAANTIIFFLSDASRWITGQTLIMDGVASLK
jgi:NAD(P)-dependent dehydrogenase (short-subunit alcohol dehydrogenase family)